MNDKLMEALLKKALGYTSKEVTEEFAGENSNELIKKKVSKKYIPPDLTAIKVYLDLAQQTNVTTLSDEELEKEKQRLLSELLKNEGIGTAIKESCAKGEKQKGKLSAELKINHLPQCKILDNSGCIGEDCITDDEFLTSEDCFNEPSYGRFSECEEDNY